MLFLFYLPILPMSGEAFYRSTILVLVALIYGLLLTLTNVYWDEAPMLFVFGFHTSDISRKDFVKFSGVFATKMHLSVVETKFIMQISKCC